MKTTTFERLKTKSGVPGSSGTFCSNRSFTKSRTAPATDSSSDDLVGISEGWQEAERGQFAERQGDSVPNPLRKKAPGRL